MRPALGDPNLVSPNLARASLRHLVAHPVETILALIGIALGVAAVLAIDLANESARRAFALSSERVAGRATHQIVGGPSGVPETLYRHLRMTAGFRAAAPVFDRDVAIVGHPGRTARLLGVDPFAEALVRERLAAAVPAEQEASLSDLLTRPLTALIARELADELGIGPGGDVAIRIATQRHTVRVLAILPPRPGLPNLMIVDVATAQELLDATGRLDRIDLVVPDDTALSRIAALLPPGVEIVPAGARAHALVEATRAFHVNLTAMSLLALFVGVFLVYSTMLFSVVQRRGLFGTLRALGVTRVEIFALVVAEAMLLGLVATALGVPLGLAMARSLVSLVTRTINDLYFVLEVRGIALSQWAIAKAAVLGIGGSVVAALIPAIEATATSPRAAMARATIERRARTTVTWLGIIGLALVAAGAAVIEFAGRGLATSYAGLFAIFLGLAVLVPIVAIRTMHVFEPVLAALLGPVGRLAARGVAGGLSRTGVAMSALAIAVAATIGVTVMIGSFRETVSRWLEASLQADVYVSPPSLVGNRPDATLPPSLIERIRAVPGVAGIGTSRVTRVTVDGVPATLVAIDQPPPTVRGFRFSDGRPDDAWKRFREGAIFVSEPFAWRRGRGAGDRLSVRADHGDVELTVGAVVRDYGSSEGLILMDRRTYDRLWDDGAVSSVAAYAAPGVDTETLALALRKATGEADVVVRASAKIRDDSLAIFDRTFAVTAVLRLLVVAVAFVGVFAALMALELERARELAVLRAQGFTPGEVWKLVTAQTGLLGLVAGLAAIPIGLTLASLLVFVINRRAFGWTLDLVLDPATLVEAVALALGAALLAGIYPAWRLTRAPLAVALREE